MSLAPNRLLLFILFSSLAIASYFTIDLPLTVYFYNHATLLFTQINEITTDFGLSYPYLIVLALLFLWFRWVSHNRQLTQAVVFIFLAIVLSGLACDILKVIFGRARPTMYFHEGLYGFYFWKFNNHMASFPSGHTTTASSVATALTLLLPRTRGVFFILILVVGLSRLALTAHYLSDVLMGAYLGIMVTYFLYRRIYTQSDLMDRTI